MLASTRLSGLSSTGGGGGGGGGTAEERQPLSIAEAAAELSVEFGSGGGQGSPEQCSYGGGRYDGGRLSPVASKRGSLVSTQI